MTDDSKEFGSLKKKVNELNGELKKIYAEIDQKRRVAEDLRKKRDLYNQRVKDLSVEASKLRDERNKLNSEANDLKKEHKSLITTIKKLDGEIKKSKKERDALNRKARGTDKKLVEKYHSGIEELLTKELPLKEEITLYKRLLKFNDRMEAAVTATELHESVIKTYGTLKEFNKRLDELSAKIDDLSALADEKHGRVIELYAKIDEVKKQSDEYHNKLLEKYKEIDPLRDKIREMSSELSPLSKELGDIQDTIKKEELKETAREIKEKLETSKRVSLNDLRILLESEESL